LTFKLCYFNFYCSVLIMANVRQVVSNNNSDTLDFLLRNKFSSLFYDDKTFVKDLHGLVLHVKFSNLVKRTAPIVVFVFHAMKSASGLQVAKLGIDCFVGRAYFFLSNVQVRGTNCTGFNCKNTVFQKITHKAY
jgi:hypothetical protein